MLRERGPTFIQAVFEVLGELIVTAGGEIIKYMGDAILAIFPAGMETWVVSAAPEMRTAFTQVAGRWELPAEILLEIGIGAGVVGVGHFGHRSLRQKDVFGEAVNCAAAIGHHRGIAVTRVVQRRIEGSNDTRRLADRPVKWRPEALEVWEVVG